MVRALQLKAYYNYLRLKASLDPKSREQLVDWQIEDLELRSNEELFEKLRAHGLFLDEHAFLDLSESCDTPEEMAATLAVEKSEAAGDQIFLILFELWSRLLPERESLSLFADHLERLMLAYARGEGGARPALQDKFVELEKILDQYVDEGMTKREALIWIQSFVSIELDEFLYSFILDEIESHDLEEASDQLEGVARYFDFDPWFSFLKAMTRIAKEPEVGYRHLEQLIDGLDFGLHIDLGLEMLQFLATTHNPILFGQLLDKVADQLKTEEDFQELAATCIDYLQELGLDKGIEELQKLLTGRSYDPKAALAKYDPALKELRSLVHEKMKVS